MNKEEFIKNLKELNIEISSQQLEQLSIYCQMLLDYNKHTNLTAIKEENQVYLKHFYDSLTITKVINLNESRNLIDIGTGAGFPGMVIKIIFPHLKVTLLDSNNKKIKFLEELIKKLSLTDITTFHGRVEDYCQKYRETYDIVTARAVSNLTILSELCLPLVKPNGYFIPLKGAAQEEIEEAKEAISILGGNIETINYFKLPIENSERNIIKIKKIKKTNITYPRRYDKILKNPLKKEAN